MYLCVCLCVCLLGCFYDYYYYRRSTPEDKIGDVYLEIYERGSNDSGEDKISFQLF